MVCVTSGLLRRLDEPEVEAVLSHELSHVAHRDVAVMTIASGLGMIAGLLTRVMFYSEIFGGGRGGGNNQQSQAALIEMLVLLVSVVVYFVSFLLTMALSRYRELAADRSGALLIGRPSLLASALVKITGEMGRIPTKDLRAAEPFNAFFFTPAVANGATQGDGGGFSFGNLFRTHPTLEKRLAQLDSLERQLGQAGPAVSSRSQRVGLFDTILGRTKPVRANLDALFALPTAALTLQSAGGLVTLGPCRGVLEAAAGPGGGRRAEGDRRAGRRRASATPRTSSTTAGSCSTTPTSRSWSPRSTWPTPPCRTTAGARSCCARPSASSPAPRRPTTPGPSGSSTSSSGAPSTPSHRSTPAKERRDTELELRIRTMVGADLPVEPDLTRWFPLWDMPVA